MIALVLGVMARSIEAGVRLPLTRSTSAKMGAAPWRITELAEAMNDLGVVMTSSPWPIPNALRASSSAEVPFMTATACLLPR